MLKNKLYISEVKKLISENKKSWVNLLRGCKYRYIYDDIILHMPKIFDGIETTYSTKVWCYLQDDSENMKWPTCKICGKNLININADINTGFPNEYGGSE